MSWAPKYGVHNTKTWHKNADGVSSCDHRILLTTAEAVAILPAGACRCCRCAKMMDVAPARADIAKATGAP